MKKVAEWIFEKEAEIRKDGSYAIEYRRLIAIDATNKVPESEFYDLFVAYRMGFFDRTLNELRASYNKFNFEESFDGFTVIVKVTKRRKFSKLVFKLPKIRIVFKTKYQK